MSHIWQDKFKDLLLNRLLSNDLILLVHSVIKLYIGIRKPSLCLRPLYWEMVGVTHTVILHTFVTASAMSNENLMEITDIRHS